MSEKSGMTRDAVARWTAYICVFCGLAKGLQVGLPVDPSIALFAGVGFLGLLVLLMRETRKEGE